MAAKESDGEDISSIIIAGIVGILLFGTILDFLSAHIATIVLIAVLIAAGVGALYRYKKHARYERGMGESVRLYNSAQNLMQRMEVLSSKQSREFYTEYFTRQLQHSPSASLVEIALCLHRQQGDFSIRTPPQGGPVEHAAYRDALRSKMQAFEDPDDTYDTFLSVIASMLTQFNIRLPTYGEQTLTAPAIDLIPDAAEAINAMFVHLYANETLERGLFLSLRQAIDANVAQVSDKHLSPAARKMGQILYPKDHPGTSREIVDDYLAGTPLHELFFEPIPFGPPFATRFEHTQVVAGSGHGKTQTLQHLILSDLTRSDPPGLVIIDSQGDMLKKLSRLSLFDPKNGALAKKLIVIDPTDVEHPPALNMFDINQDRFRGYGAATREQILNGVIELYDYIFGSLLGAELTQKQSVIFRYLARLMITIPGATIHDLLRLMENITPYLKHVEALPLGSRTFFETDFVHKSFDQTKQQIRRRLLGILENPTFERMFTAPKNRIDMFQALNSGSIVLVNTAKDFLKPERSSLLGRFFIALTLQAVLERAALPEAKRRPAFLYIDEAADYFDDNVDDLLTQARKYQLGVVFAHQYLDQLVGGLRASIAANTSIKLAGGVSDRDARSLAPDMRTSAEFILGQQKRKATTEFACHIRNHIPTAISLTIPLGTLEKQPTLLEPAYAQLIATNRNRVSTVTAAAPTAAAPAATATITTTAPQKQNDKPIVNLPELKIGDYVQWESGGIQRLELPSRVRAIEIHDGKKWVLIDGSETGIPFNEIRVALKPASRPNGNMARNEPALATKKSPEPATPARSTTPKPEPAAQDTDDWQG